MLSKVITGDSKRSCAYNYKRQALVDSTVSLVVL